MFAGCPFLSSFTRRPAVSELERVGDLDPVGRTLLSVALDFDLDREGVARSPNSFSLALRSLVLGELARCLRSTLSIYAARCTFRSTRFKADQGGSAWGFSHGSWLG